MVGTVQPVRKRLLIVDDEPMLAKALHDVLTDRYDVTVANGGPAALSLLARDDDFDVILTDVNMPDLSGLELYERLAAEHPDLAGRTIFMSGGILSAVNRERLEASLRPLLDKPFGVERLHALLACVPHRRRS